MDLVTLGWFCVGLILLVLGGELLVRGASGIARRFGMTPLVIGLTVVALGTSAPELVVALAATLNGNHGIAVGNAVGSNIFNVLGDPRRLRAGASARRGAAAGVSATSP